MSSEKNDSVLRSAVILSAKHTTLGSKIGSIAENAIEFTSSYSRHTLSLIGSDIFSIAYVHCDNAYA